MDLHLLPFIVFSQDVRNIWILILFSKQQWMIDLTERKFTFSSEGRFGNYTKFRWITVE